MNMEPMGCVDTTGMRWEEALQLLADSGRRIAGIEVTRPAVRVPPASAPWRVVRQMECEPGYLHIVLVQECGYEGKPLVAVNNGTALGDGEQETESNE